MSLLATSHMSLVHVSLCPDGIHNLKGWNKEIIEKKNENICKIKVCILLGSTEGR